MLTRLALALIGRAERRLGVGLDYARQIARTDIRLLMRYNRIFGFLDPRRHLPPEAYHAARIRGALSADCGTCVEAEINLARAAGLEPELIAAILSGAAGGDLAPVIRLADAVTVARADDPEARAAIRQRHGEAGLIELSFAMTGAALLPGIKRAMGHATTCDLGRLRQVAGVAP